MECPAIAPPVGLRPLLRAGLWLDRSFAFSFHSLKVETACPIPPTGGGILVCNHLSGLDPVLVQAACPRLISWMMAREYYDVAALTWIFKLIDAVPVTRSRRDPMSVRTALRALGSGKILGVFPEGRIATEKELLPFHLGTAMMAMSAGVPVYPTCVEGGQRNKEMLEAFLFPNEVRLRFGAPLRFDATDTSHQALVAATRAIRAAVEQLRHGDPRDPVPAP